MDKIVCVGKNYAEHARELGDAVPEKPVLFLKPPSVLVAAGAAGETVRAALPRGAGAVHHECEIVLRLRQGGYRMDRAAAAAAIGEVALGLDMTLRDLQADLKKRGHPWTVSKVFPGAAVVGPWRAAAQFPEYLDTPFALAVDGALRQRGQGAQMMLGPAECVAYISEFFPLVAGDLIFTGTPAGVGPVVPGQTGELTWGGLAYRIAWE